MKIISIIQIIVSIFLVISILLQQRGAGLSGAFGGSFGGYYTKRGFEKFLVYFSVALAALFIGLAIANLVLSGTKQY
ncbi:MAG TPA: preprotein translocase subunit SecG [Patescibacteria group bacterium]|nr:preprotein translocase subunit SecG [Patescibacteria group bacterium]